MVNLNKKNKKALPTTTVKTTSVAALPLIRTTRSSGLFYNKRCENMVMTPPEPILEEEVDTNTSNVGGD